MTEKTTPCAHCSRMFIDASAVRQHTRHRHPGVNLEPMRKGNRRRAARARAASTRNEFTMSPDDAYEFVEALDLPDGAHWALIEELSGAEPADFAR